jgi:hypothetical protein
MIEKDMMTVRPLFFSSCVAFDFSLNSKKEKVKLIVM